MRQMFVQSVFFLAFSTSCIPDTTSQLSKGHCVTWFSNVYEKIIFIDLFQTISFFLSFWNIGKRGWSCVQ